jgi:hypothetical protein
MKIEIPATEAIDTIIKNNVVDATPVSLATPLGAGLISSSSFSFTLFYKYRLVFVIPF